MQIMDLGRHTQRDRTSPKKQIPKHFGLAHGTLPTICPFSEWVDWGTPSDLILEGEFNNQEQQYLNRHYSNT